MNLLTATELSALMNDAGWLSSTEMTWQHERLEKLAGAIIAKLSQGVSVEPDIHPDAWAGGFYSRDRLNTAIAAARVQLTAKLEPLIDFLEKQSVLAERYRDYEAIQYVLKDIRALIGANHAE